MKLTPLYLFSLVAGAGFAQPEPPRLSLQQAQSAATLSSPILRAARAELAMATATHRGLRTEIGPKASVNGFATSGNNSSILGSAPLTDPGVNMQVPMGQFLSSNFMLMIPLLTNQLKEMVRASEWQTRAAAGDYREVQAELEFRITESYYRALFATQEVAAAAAQLRATQEMLRTTEARVESGSAIPASAERVRAEVARGERELAASKSEAAKELLELKHAIGLELGEEIALEPNPETASHSTELSDLVAQATQRRGVLIAARARLESSHADLRSAQAQSQPKIYALGMADATNRRGMGGITVGLTASFAVFDGGRNRADVAKSRALRERSDAMLADLSLEVEKEVRQAVLDVETSESNLRSAEASLKSAQSAYEVMSLRVSAGKGILLEQLDALGVLKRANADLAQARFDRHVAQARITRATGGSR